MGRRRSPGRAQLHGHFFGQSSSANRALAPAASVIKVPATRRSNCSARSRAASRPVPSPCSTSCAPTRGDLAVFRAGGVGPSAVLAAVHLTGATATVVDVNPARLELATRLRVADVINAGEQDPGARWVQRRAGHRSHAGSDRRPLRARQAIGCSHHSVCDIVGAPAPDAGVDEHPRRNREGLGVVGINQGDAVPREAIPTLVELHRQGRFPFDELIRVYAFEDIQQAAEDAADGTVVKPVLRMPEADALTRRS